MWGIIGFQSDALRRKGRLYAAQVVILSVGSVIKELREKRKLTQKELADKISVRDKTVLKWII